MTSLNRSLVRSWLPCRSVDAHKGSCGRLLIVSGSVGMTGAPVLVAQGALRAGAGLVKLAVPKTQQSIVAKRSPIEVTSVGLPDKGGHLSRSAWTVINKTISTFRPTLIAAGPGLSACPDVRFIVEHLWKRVDMPLVLDADALNVLSMDIFKVCRRAPVILTPHEAEWARMLKTTSADIHQRRQQVVNEPRNRGSVVTLLKGHQTLIGDGNAIWSNTTGHSSMASGGMGDVLTGIVAGLWGQYPIQSIETAVRAAGAGAFVHGLSGELTFRQGGGLSVLATEVAMQIPLALKTVLENKKKARGSR